MLDKEGQIVNNINAGWHSAKVPLAPTIEVILMLLLVLKELVIALLICQS